MASHNDVVPDEFIINDLCDRDGIERTYQTAERFPMPTLAEEREALEAFGIEDDLNLLPLILADDHGIADADALVQRHADAIRYRLRAGQSFEAIAAALQDGTIDAV